MIFSRNNIFTLVLMFFLESTMSVYGKLTKCEENIFTDFKYTLDLPTTVRYEMPRTAFLEKTINDFTNDDAKNYFEHLHKFLHHKDSMQLPREYCDSKTKSLRLRVNKSRKDEYENCVALLRSTFLDSQDKTDIIKNTFLYFTSDIISNFNTEDYRYKYYHYLCGKMIYFQTANQKFPMTVLEFCTNLHPSSDIDLMSRVDFEPTKQQVVESCTTKIFNDFGIIVMRQQQRAKLYIPRKAFLVYVEDDLESPDSKDYFFHIYGVIKAKDKTYNPRSYCKIITKEDLEEEICVSCLLEMYLDSDATTVLKDAFLNFKESDIAVLDENDYRIRYFYYLSGCYDFHVSEIFKKTPLTPSQFCQMDRTKTINPRIFLELTSINEDGTSTSTSRQT